MSRDRLTHDEALALAIRWAEAGIPAHPVAISWDDKKQATNKRPLSTNGFRDATVDTAMVARLFNGATIRRGEVWAVGLHLGPAGLMALDVDVKGGARGDEELLILEEEHGRLPDTPRVVTGSGGGHIWLRKGDRYISNRDLVDGHIEVRSDDGFIVAPGVVTPWGSWLFDHETGDVLDGAPVAGAPDWVLARLNGAGPAAGGSGGTRGHWRDLDPAALHPADMAALDALLRLGGHGQYVSVEHKDGATRETLRVTRPGKRSGTSATVGYVAPGAVKVFSPKWAVFADDQEPYLHAGATYDADHLADIATAVEAGDRAKAAAMVDPLHWAAGVSEADEKPQDRPETAPAPKGPPLVLPPPKNPLAVARVIVDEKYRRDTHLVLRYWRGSFHRWHGAHWAELEDGAIRSDLYATLGRAVFKHDKGKEPWQPTRHKVTDVADALRAHVHLPEAVEAPVWLDGGDGPPASELVAVRNGLLHIPTRCLLDHDPRFFNRVSVDLDYNPEAPEPTRWLEFLAELWPDDDQADSISTLCEYLGYCISGDTSLHKALLMIGPTRAGKGVIARVAAALMGRRNVVGPTLASLGQNFGLAPLIGKPLAVVSDARLGQGSHLVVERLLSITGEDALTVDRKYKEPWTGKLPTRFMIISNELPRFGDSSRAIARRFVVLMLSQSWLGQENPKLTGQLLTELPGILCWALDGLERLQARGHFLEPKGSVEAITALEDLASPVAAFVRDRCEVKAGGDVAVDALYKAWRSWCEEQGRDKPGTAQVFGRDLRAVIPGLSLRRPRDEDGRQRYYQGIALRPPEPQGTNNKPASRTIEDHDARSTMVRNNSPLLVTAEVDLVERRVDPEVAAARRYLDDQELLG